MDQVKNQEGNASRRQPGSMSNSKGRANQMRTAKYALWPLGDGQPLCKDRVPGEVGCQHLHGTKV